MNAETVRRTRIALDEIQRLLLALDRDTRGSVLDVLSALRGPDTRFDVVTAEKLKATTTSYVRRAAFPELTAQADNNVYRWAHMPIPAPPMARYDEASDLVGAHFAEHINGALFALGLPQLP